MSSLRRDTVQGTVIAVVEDLIQDWGLELSEPVNPATQLVAHLEFASVDIIQLCVALEQCFERKLGFQDLLMRDGSYVGDLNLAQFAKFIELRIKSVGGAPP
jgi:acyl carrier protein